eukprot:gene8258-5778_t
MSAPSSSLEVEAIRASLQGGHTTVYYTSLSSLPAMTPTGDSVPSPSTGGKPVSERALDDSYGVCGCVPHPQYLHCGLVNQPLEGLHERKCKVLAGGYTSPSTTVWMLNLQHAASRNEHFLHLSSFLTSPSRQTVVVRFRNFYCWFYSCIVFPFSFSQPVPVLLTAIHFSRLRLNKVERETYAMAARRSSGSSSNSSGKVQITVRDKAARRTEVFYCPLQLLSQGMRYFQPLIQKQIDEQQNAQAKSKEEENASPTIALKVNCSTDIFRWLLAHLKGENPKFSYSNAVSIVLSSHFLRMDTLTDTALEYVRDNLADVLVSGVDMDCIPGELLGRFCTITREYHVASALLELYDRGEDEHAGRSFLSTVARHLAMIRLSGKTVATSSKRRWDQSTSLPQGASEEAKGGDTPTCSTSNGENENMGIDNGLRWCRLCGILYDSVGIQRLLLSGKCYEPPCDALTNNAELRMGPRGEVFTTHVASDAPVAITPPSTWDPPKIEHWAWQAIGSILLVICTVCHHPCSLIEAISHSCPNAQFTTEEPGFGSPEMDVILRWLQLCIEEKEQQGEMHYLVPLRASKTESSTLEVESIVMPRYRISKQSRSDGTGLGNSADSTVPYTWQGQMHKVNEVALGYESGIDVDLLSYYERKMMAQLVRARSAEAPARQAPRRRLAISSQNGQPLSYLHPSGDDVALNSHIGKGTFSSSVKGSSLRPKQAFASTIGSAAQNSVSSRALTQTLPAAGRRGGAYSSRTPEATFPADYLKRSAKIAPFRWHGTIVLLSSCAILCSTKEQSIKRDSFIIIIIIVWIAEADLYGVRLCVDSFLPSYSFRFIFMKSPQVISRVDSGRLLRKPISNPVKSMLNGSHECASSYKSRKQRRLEALQNGPSGQQSCTSGCRAGRAFGCSGSPLDTHQVVVPSVAAVKSWRKTRLILS